MQRNIEEKNHACLERLGLLIRSGSYLQHYFDSREKFTTQTITK
uniref:Uncharacterized protein n=1 Tax=Rhizophora mucronata TaxID=61149 RepID=A0A2P2QTE0_RHIMU